MKPRSCRSYGKTWGNSSCQGQRENRRPNLFRYQSFSWSQAANPEAIRPNWRSWTNWDTPSRGTKFAVHPLMAHLYINEIAGISCCILDTLLVLLVAGKHRFAKRWHVLGGQGTDVAGTIELLLDACKASAWRVHPAAVGENDQWWFRMVNDGYYTRSIKVNTG